MTLVLLDSLLDENMTRRKAVTVLKKLSTVNTIRPDGTQAQTDIRPK